SPDMNPIEKAYSKLKAFLRKIAERTVAGLLIALDACADIFKPAECVNQFNKPVKLRELTQAIEKLLAEPPDSLVVRPLRTAYALSVSGGSRIIVVDD